MNHSKKLLTSFSDFDFTLVDEIGLYLALPVSIEDYFSKYL